MSPDFDNYLEEFLVDSKGWNNSVSEKRREKGR